MFEMSATTRAICDILRTVNGEFAYTTLCAQLKMPMSAIRGALASARRALEREHIVFGVIRGVGLRRLNDSETARSTSKFVKQINRTAKRGTRRFNAIHEFSRLPNADQLTATLNKTLFEAVRSHTSLKNTSVHAAAAKPSNADVARLVAAK